MQQSNIIINQRFLHQLVLWMIVYVAASCSGGNPGQPDVSVKKDTIQSPVIVAAKPSKIIRLDTCPPPVILAIPTKQRPYIQTIEGKEFKLQLKPPETRPANF